MLKWYSLNTRQLSLSAASFDSKFANPLIAHNNTINHIDYWAAWTAYDRFVCNPITIVPNLFTFWYTEMLWLS